MHSLLVRSFLGKVDKILLKWPETASKSRKVGLVWPNWQILVQKGVHLSIIWRVGSIAVVYKSVTDLCSLNVNQYCWKCWKIWCFGAFSGLKGPISWAGRWIEGMAGLFTDFLWDKIHWWGVYYWKWSKSGKKGLKKSPDLLFDFIARFLGLQK